MLPDFANVLFLQSFMTETMRTAFDQCCYTHSLNVTISLINIMIFYQFQDGKWKEVRILEDVKNTKELHMYIFRNASEESEVFWALDNFRICSAEGMYNCLRLGD